MSVGPFGGVLGSAAGAPAAQTQGADNERSKTDSATRSRRQDADKKTEQSSGVGQASEDQGTSDRDADGRRLWEAPPPADDSATDPATGLPAPTSKDASGKSGGQLDLSG